MNQVVAPLNDDDVEAVFGGLDLLQGRALPVPFQRVNPNPNPAPLVNLVVAPLNDDDFANVQNVEQKQVVPMPLPLAGGNAVLAAAVKPPAMPAIPAPFQNANPKPPANVKPPALPVILAPFQNADPKPPANANAKPAAAMNLIQPPAPALVNLVVAPLNFDDLVNVQAGVNPPFEFVAPPNEDEDDVEEVKQQVAPPNRDDETTFVTECMVTVNSLFAWITRLVDWNTDVFSSFRDNLARFATNETTRYQFEEADYFNRWTRGNGVGMEQYQVGHLDIQGPLPPAIRANINQQVRYGWLRRMILDQGWRQEAFAPIHRYMDKWAAAAATVLSKVTERKELTVPQLLTTFDRTTIDASNRLIVDFDRLTAQTLTKANAELEKMWDQVQGRMGRTLLAEAKQLERERDTNIPPQGNAVVTYEEHMRMMYGRLIVAIMRAYEAITEKAYPDAIAAVADRETKRMQREEEAKRFAEQMRLVSRFKDRVFRLLVQKQAIENEARVQVNNNGNDDNDNNNDVVPMVIDQLEEEGARVDEDVPMQLLGVIDPTKLSAEELNRIADYMEELYRKYAVLKKVNEVLLAKYQDARISDLVRRFTRGKREIHTRPTRDELRDLEQLVAESVGVKTAQYQPMTNLSLQIDEETRLSLWPIKPVSSAANVPRAYGPLYHFAQMMAGAANTNLDLILVRIFPDIASGSTLWHLVMGRVEDEFRASATDNDYATRRQRWDRAMFERTTKLRDLRKRAADEPLNQDLQTELHFEEEKMWREDNREYERIVNLNGASVQTHARHTRLNDEAKAFSTEDIDALEEKLLALMATPEQKEEAQREIRQKRLLQIRVGLNALRELNKCASLDDLLRYMPEFYVPTASYAILQMHEFVKSDARWRKVPLYELMFAETVSLRFAALCGTHMLLYAMENSSEKLDMNRYELARKNHETNAFQFFGNKLQRKKAFEWESVYNTK